MVPWSLNRAAGAFNKENMVAWCGSVYTQSTFVVLSKCWCQSTLSYGFK